MKSKTLSGSECYPQDSIPVLGLLEGVQKRPGMYFEGGANLACLEALIMGIWIAENHHKSKESVLEIGLLDFEQWVRKKLKERAINIRSFQFARQRCDGDEVKAFYLWFEWCNEYLLRSRK